MKNFLWFVLHLKAVFTVAEACLMQTLCCSCLPYADIMLQLNRLWIDAHYISRSPAGGCPPRWRRMGRRGEGGSGGSTASLPSPFPSPCKRYESSLTNRGTVTEQSHQRIKDKNFTHSIWPTLLIATVWTHRECVLSVVFAKHCTDNTHLLLLDCYHISNFVSVE